MSTPVWQPGTVYTPNAIVAPRTTDIVVTEQPNNNSFEEGGGSLTDWTVTGEYCADVDAQGATTASTAEAFDGSNSATASPIAGDGTGPNTSGGKPVAFIVLTNAFQADVTPGQTINFKMRAWHLFVPDTSQTWPYSAGARIAWYDASLTFLSYSYADTVSAGSLYGGGGGSGFFTGGGSGGTTYKGPLAGMVAFQDGVWVTVSGSAVAPAGAAFAAAVCVIATTDYGTQADYVDDFTWDYTHQGFPPGLVFVATQSTPGTTASVEPIWPTTAGVSVVDGSVTWTAEFASQITWTASSILTSDATEPVWPLKIGGQIADGTIEWTATDGRVTDTNCPNSKSVAIGSAKVFATDNDIIRYSATTNALDWSTPKDAGFIPFGLQSYGNESCKGLGLYRSNLVAFNSLGYQMWQIDPDPNNIAILDAEPVGCSDNRTIQPANNDLVFYSPVGIRNIGTAGSSGNLQAGQFGKQVDSLVNGLVKVARAAGLELRGLFNPGTGQYWMTIGTDVIVLSINGNSVMSWSRYTFPAEITDWTVMDGALYLRAGDLVWQLNVDALNDDVDAGAGQGGANVGFPGRMSWNYLDCGVIGIDKTTEGFDVVIGAVDDSGLIVQNNNVVCNITFGYNQADRSQATDPYSITGDTVPGTLVPFEITAPTFQVRLDFATGQNWGWGAMNLYMEPG